MVRIIGKITSKSSGITYSVKFDSSERSVWVSQDGVIWTLVYQKVASENDAIQCAQKHIDFQKDLF